MGNLLGQSLGRYHILEQLGEGGMATVYKAFDTRLERDVAVKIIRRESFPPDQLDRILKRFEREAKALAKLSHPNIVGVIDYGDYDGSPYLVMEFLPSGTLKDRLGKPISWQEAARVLLPVARALQYAHKQGVVHRDIKPSNILITESGEPMLADFGIAKILTSSETTTLTETGIGVGTPEYMAPEQWTGNATAQSDLYSMGIVFYEMVTGRKPYTAETPAAILLKQATEPLPRPTQFVHNVPEGVERILLKALARKPEDRYPDIGAFVDGMEQFAARWSAQKIPAATLSASSLETRAGTVKEKTPNLVPNNPTLDEMKAEGEINSMRKQSDTAVMRGRFPLKWIIVALAAIVLLGLSIQLGIRFSGLDAQHRPGSNGVAGTNSTSVSQILSPTATPAHSPIYTVSATFTETDGNIIISKTYPITYFHLPSETLYTIGFQGEGVCRVNSQTMELLDCRTNSIYNAHQIVWNSMLGEIYVSDLNGDKVSVVSPSSLEEIGLYTKNIGWNSYSMEVSADGKYVYLSNHTSDDVNAFIRIVAIETTRRVTRTTKVLAYTDCDVYLTQSKVNNQIYVSWNNHIDTYTTPDLGLLDSQSDSNVQAGNLIELPDGESLLLTQDNKIIIWSLVTNQIEKAILLPGISGRSKINLSKDESRIWITGDNLLYDLPLPISAKGYTSLQLDATPTGMAESTTEKLLYIALQNNQLRIYNYSAGMLSQPTISIPNISDILVLPGSP